MKVLENQTLYQCEHCGKRLMTKHGARLHEREYCSVVKEAEQKKRQGSCEHKHMEMSYCTMPGEGHLQIPDYECCIDCGMSEMEIAEQKNKFQEASHASK
ncbi:hypothetical protein NYE57_18295 [Bacillus sp. FSL L8-0222]|uniref:hypothetical protein n=1 Tax=Bacillus TaxID=1386 RepID=UPI00227FA98E|nr:hypothetical protein [Bacillus inaquosorum]MCY7952194.1 hypothetical protein [Bacillus inaquosorum]